MSLSEIIDFITGVAILVGLLLAVNEVRQFHKSRKRDSAIKVFEIFTRPDVAKGIWLVVNLPDKKFGFEELENYFGEDIEYVNRFAIVIEGLGVLVKNREISVSLVEDYFGGPIILFWRKMGWYEKEIRKKSGRSTYAEFCEWLAELLIARESDKEPIPAFIEYADWEE